MGKPESADLFQEGRTRSEQSPFPSGYIRIPRDIWDDPCFRSGVMSEREAYLFMHIRAAWRCMPVRANGKAILLERGQLVAAGRWRAQHLGWTEPKVRRFLKRLVDRRRITVSVDAGINVITLLEYDIIQGSGPKADAVPAESPTRERRKRKTDNQIAKGPVDFGGQDQSGSGEAAGSARTPRLSDADARMLVDLRRAVGLGADHDKGYWYDTHVLKHIACWRGLGLSDERIVAEAKDSRAKNPEVPDGPKALDRWMRAAAQERGARPHARNDNAVGRRSLQEEPHSEEVVLQWFADLVNSPRYLAPSTVNNTMAYELLMSGLVTREKLRERGIAV